MLKSFPLGVASHVLEESCFVALYLKLLAQWGKDLEKAEKRGPLGEAEAEAEMGILHSSRSQLIQICSLLWAPYQTLPVHDSLDSIGNRPSISPKPSEHPYPRPNPSQQEWLSLSPETFSDACLH